MPRRLLWRARASPAATPLVHRSSPSNNTRFFLPRPRCRLNQSFSQGVPTACHAVVPRYASDRWERPRPLNTLRGGLPRAGAAPRVRSIGSAEAPVYFAGRLSSSGHALIDSGVQGRETCAAANLEPLSRTDATCQRSQTEAESNSLAGPQNSTRAGCSETNPPVDI